LIELSNEKPIIKEIVFILFDNGTGISYFNAGTAEKVILPKEKRMFTTAKRAMRLLSVLIIIFIGGNSVLFAESEKPEDSKADIRKKLRETVIDYLEFNDIKVSEAVKRLSEEYEIKIILKLDKKGEEPTVGLALEKRNLYQVIYFLCKSAKLRFRVEKYAVVIQRDPFPEIPETGEEIQREKERDLLTQKNTLLTEQRLEKIIFPEIEFYGDHIFTVIRYLNRYSKRNDPDEKSIIVIAGFDKETADELPGISMEYSNISMKEILLRLCQSAKLKYKTQENVVILLTSENRKGLQKNSSSSAKPQKLVLIEARIFNKPKPDSPVSEYELVSAPKIITSPGHEAALNMTREHPVGGKKYIYGFIMTMSPTLNGDDIKLKGKISLSKAPQSYKNKDVDAYMTDKKEISYEINFKEPHKPYSITFKDGDKILEIAMTAMLIDQTGIPLK
jgi:hypothetical protein